MARVAQLTDPVDRAAAAVLAGLQARSFRYNREYCGLLGYDRDGRLFATRASRGHRDVCQPREGSDMVTIIASYHTHGAAAGDTDTEAPSLEDLFADVSEGIDGYVATPGGRLWKIEHRKNAAFLICDTGCMPTDARHRECARFAPPTYLTEDLLAERQFNDFSDC